MDVEFTVDLIKERKIGGRGWRPMSTSCRSVAQDPFSKPCRRDNGTQRWLMADYGFDEPRPFYLGMRWNMTSRTGGSALHGCRSARISLLGTTAHV